MGVVFLIVIIVIAVWVLASCVRIVPQAYAVILERLGAYQATWSTGIHFKVPFIERVARKVNLKEQVVDFPPQPVITKDNVTMQIDTVVFCFYESTFIIVLSTLSFVSFSDYRFHFTFCFFTVDQPLYIFLPFSSYLYERIL